MSEDDKVAYQTDKVIWFCVGAIVNLTIVLLGTGILVFEHIEHSPECRDFWGAHE